MVTTVVDSYFLVVIYALKSMVSTKSNGCNHQKYITSSKDKQQQQQQKCKISFRSD